MFPEISVILLEIGGIMAPPTIDIINKLEAGFVSAPAPSIPKAKIVGNMIDIKNVSATNAYNVEIPDPKITQIVRIILTTL